MWLEVTRLDGSKELVNMVYCFNVEADGEDTTLYFVCDKENEASAISVKEPYEVFKGVLGARVR